MEVSTVLSAVLELGEDETPVHERDSATAIFPSRILLEAMRMLALQTDAIIAAPTIITRI